MLKCICHSQGKCHQFSTEGEKKYGFGMTLDRINDGRISFFFFFLEITLLMNFPIVCGEVIQSPLKCYMQTVTCVSTHMMKLPRAWSTPHPETS